jgi:hypothetical protein
VGHARVAGRVLLETLKKVDKRLIENQATAGQSRKIHLETCGRTYQNVV